MSPLHARQVESQLVQFVQRRLHATGHHLHSCSFRNRDDRLPILVDLAVHAINLNFAHAQGDIDLFLYTVDGIQIASSLSTDDNESISLEGIQAGRYFIQVADR